MATLVGLPSKIFVPRGVTEAAVTGIEGEGATVTRVAGTYDQAVAAAKSAGDQPDVIVTPVGVGSLVQASVVHTRSPEAAHPSLLSVEPITAAWPFLKAGIRVGLASDELRTSMGVTANSMIVLLSTESLSANPIDIPAI